MAEPSSFYAQLREAVLHPIVGWNFDWIKGRVIRGEYPWNYTQRVKEWVRGSPDLLDMGTGGGEWLSQLDSRPRRTVATESYAPNVPVARQRLASLGVDLVRILAAPDNAEQEGRASLVPLPFQDSSFHLVVNRHEAYVPSEVARVLAPGGRFLTQQVGDGFSDDWCRLFGRTPPELSRPRWGKELAVRQLQGAGLRVLHAEEGGYTTEFKDIGAIVWYLLAVPWTLPGFSVDREVPTLRELDRRIRSEGPILLRSPGFLVEAERPESSPRPGRTKRAARGPGKARR